MLLFYLFHGLKSKEKTHKIQNKSFSFIELELEQKRPIQKKKKFSGVFNILKKANT
jgi:hypothetical protein